MKQLGIKMMIKKWLMAVSLLLSSTLLYAQEVNIVESPLETPEGLSCTMPLLWKTERILQPYPRTPLLVEASGVYTGNDSVYRLDRKTGETIWEFKVPDSSYDLAFGSSGINALSVDDDTVYFGGYAQRIFALDKKTGEERWRHDATHIKEAFAQDTQHLYFNGFGTTYALDKKTGAVVWSFDSMGAPTLDGKYIYVGWSNIFYALDKTNGNIVWESKHPEGTGYVALNTVPYLYAGQVFVSEFQSRAISSLDAKTGEWLWSTKGHRVYGDARVILGQDNRHALVFSMSGLLILYDIKAQKPIWQFQTSASRSYMPPVLYKGVLLMSSQLVGIYGVDYKTGQEVLRFEYGDRMDREALREARALQVYEDVLYMTAIDGKVHAYKLDCPQLKGR